MKQAIQTSLTVISILSLCIGLSACGDRQEQPSDQSAGDAVSESNSDAGAAGGPTDVVARVGDQEITFSEINTMLNSSAVVGVSVPALGTPERDTVRITLLDKIVSANLLYLDALKKEVHKDPDYQRDMQKFRNAILVSLYRDRHLADSIKVSDEEIEAYHQSTDNLNAEITDEVRTAITAVLRKQKLEKMSAELRAKLREGVSVEIDESQLDPLQDAERADDTVLASIDGSPMTWGEVKPILGGKVSSASIEDRRKALNGLIDRRILVDKANASGLDVDPVYLARYNEYQKTRLINLHRANLAEGFEPTDEELKAYYEDNRDDIITPEFRKVQFVVVKTEEEANELKQKLDAGEMTTYEAARDHSIDPGAKQNLGEIGWVSRGKGWPEVDEVIFALGPGEIGGPVETPAGWNLLLVQDVREAQNDDLSQPRTRKQTRRKYIHEKLAEYVVNLRKNEFPVEVYEDRLVALAQQEADMVKQLAERAAESGSVTQQRIEEMQKIYQQGGQ